MPPDVYRERAALVAFVAAVFGHAWFGTDPDEPDWPVLYIWSPEGQLSWHISPGDMDLFGHVAKPPYDPPKRPWDGHDTEEKYRRLAEMTRRIAESNARELEHEPSDAGPTPPG